MLATAIHGAVAVADRRADRHPGYRLKARR
jgi:hypothetical protein